MQTSIPARITQSGLVAVVRSADPAPLVDALHALLEGGISVAEVTLTVPDALGVLQKAKAELGDRMILGAGTVLDPETCRAAILAGADFIVSPTLNLEVIALTRRYGKASLPGAFTPTEILAAYQAGADIVKVFPAECLGPAFFKAMRGPLPQIPLMPTGGVDLNTAASFLHAGAVALGLGSQLLDAATLAARDFATLTRRARQYVEIVTKTRSA
jgi:2-dehydro-3-deoxyphosphogluconate aldolase / (4S)-4-hydroxy-2-oxoglutarate aldolase